MRTGAVSSNLPTPQALYRTAPLQAASVLFIHRSVGYQRTADCARQSIRL